MRTGAGPPVGADANETPMKLTAAVITAWLACSACSAAGPAPPLVIDLDKAFSLRVGEAAKTADGALHVGFEQVTADSRCPRGEQCVWAGDATARVWLQQGTGPRLPRELHTAPGAQQATRLAGYELHLNRLDPYPTSGRVVAPDAAVVTLTLSRATQPEADR